jgi:hypothetical protein
VALWSASRGRGHGLMTHGRSGIASRHRRYWMRADGRRRKRNEWKEANTKDSKDSGYADLTVSSLVVAREIYGATITLAGCDE